MGISITQMGALARQSAAVLAAAGTEAKNRALFAIANGLEPAGEAILEANSRDLASAIENGLSPAMQDRLRLDQKRIRGMAQGVRQVAALADPVGRVIGGGTGPDGLQIIKRTVPLGVVAIIFESRPNVTVDCAALCIKAGNACILRGGKEAIHSNTALAGIIRAALESAGLPADGMQLVEDTGRQSATALMNLTGYVDVLIPRGGQGLIRAVVENARVPVIETGAGNCHIFVDATADLEMAAKIVDNAKTSRPSVCNAAETVLVHREVADNFLPMMARSLAHADVQLRCCPRGLAILGGKATAATEDDWFAEYLDYILAVRVVDGLDEAIGHIARYSTHHSEAIITRDAVNAKQFCDRVDSAAVYVNASTRFTDGGALGLGAEIGISTQKLHARGPMGLNELVSYKYIIAGEGQIRE